LEWSTLVRDLLRLLIQRRDSGQRRDSVGDCGADVERKLQFPTPQEILRREMERRDSFLDHFIGGISRKVTNFRDEMV
jgi:hypothetical protein